MATKRINMKPPASEKVNGIRTFNPANRSDWRRWLATNGDSTEPVCLVLFNKKSSSPNLTYGDAVEEALCFGWIDNKGMKRDDESMYLQFTPRKPNGNWSKLNKERAEKMIQQGLMTDAGQVFIDIAKKSGKWDAALKADVIPPDLQRLSSKRKRLSKTFNLLHPPLDDSLFSGSQTQKKRKQGSNELKGPLPWQRRT